MASGSANPVQIKLGETELILTKSIWPYLGQLGIVPNVLCYLLLVATQQVCKFSLAGCWHVVEICLRIIESANQLGFFIWDITIED